jgi:cytochrome c oxidase assembly factor CtaG
MMLRDEAVSEQVTFGPVRRALALGALVALAVAVAPPLATEARRYLSFETLQFGLLGLVIPALLVLAAPWRLFGLGERLESRSTRERPAAWHAAFVLVPAVGVLVLWRTPGLVDALSRHPYLLVLEAVTLLPAGTLVWLELVASPPSYPRLSPLGRIPAAAITMWALWTLAYIVGFDASGAYPAYAHLTGRALSQGADEQVAAGLLWAVGAVCFVPVLFASLMSFLRSEERRAPRTP